MKYNMKSKRYTGTTLNEVMLAILVVTISIIGGISYRYYSALDGKRASMYSTAARAALLLCESFRGAAGIVSYDPATHLSSDDFVITADSGPEAPGGFTSIGSYKVILNGVTCYATLSYQDVQPGLRALNVTVAYQKRDQAVTGLEDMDNTFALTTYVSSL